MILTNLVPDVKTCERLAKLGYPQDSQLKWYSFGKNPFVELRSTGKLLASAPTSAEIVYMFPTKIEIEGTEYFYSHGFTLGGEWSIDYSTIKDNNCCSFVHVNEVQCRADLMIWLLERGHVKLK